MSSGVVSSGVVSSGFVSRDVVSGDVVSVSSTCLAAVLIRRPCLLMKSIVGSGVKRAGKYLGRQATLWQWRLFEDVPPGLSRLICMHLPFQLRPGR